ncbi:hypothetical protein PR202_ga11799 [Eleusine coracana subsp. coracana]|uniref:Sodium/calcium exchanger membrane region domain-containing protein n=1 Tax=Eleusine coracana subsp. coracana TaxID=191504 RepID=A0AAV5CAE5_ELECO|nr:hypothetical protein PR202_ga11799 [Eleusine coracana subsp. coracana]
MAFLHKLHNKRRRNAAATTIASVSFLVLVFSIFLATQHNNNDLHELGGTFFFPSIVSPHHQSLQELRAKPGKQGSSSSCQQELQSLPDHAARCRFLTPSSPCAPQGYVDYLRLFYCLFGGLPWLGGAALLLWLLLLFYLLGDTASEYFCASLEGLSAALRLPPAVAGATLLSLGNGAPDVLSSVVAFNSSSSSSSGDVGISSVLGGALFVSTVVAGAVAVVAGRRGAPPIERRGFLRDACFLLVALAYLLAVLLTGSVTVLAAASFLSLYAAYVILVSASHCCHTSSSFSDADSSASSTNLLAAPLLHHDADADDDGPPPLPIVSNTKPTPPPPARPKKTASRRALDLLHAPLYLPRRLTIPDIAAHRWSKPYAVTTTFLAPLLLAAATSPNPSLLLTGLLTGLVLAAATAHWTASAGPPDARWARLAWLGGGFLMSVLWSYVLARELVALLVASGLIAGVRPTVLGATVLAWGNSLGDLVADVAMAAHDGGAQTAVAGCYAGPAFNTVVGLGISLTMAAGATYPDPYRIPVDGSVYEALGFLAVGLVWAIVVLPLRGMRLDRVLGAGLLAVYLCFLCVRLGSLGVLGLSSS